MIQQLQTLCQDLTVNLQQLKQNNQEIEYRVYCDQIQSSIQQLQQNLNSTSSTNINKLIQSTINTQKIHTPKPVPIAFEIMFMPDNKDNLITQDTKDVVYSTYSQNRFQQILLPDQLLLTTQSFDELYLKIQEIETCVKHDQKDSKIFNYLQNYNQQTTPYIRQSPSSRKYIQQDDESESQISEPIFSDPTSSQQNIQQHELRERVLKSQQRHKDLEQQQMEKINEQMERTKQKAEKIKQQKILYAIQIKEKSKEQTLRGLQKRHELEQQKIQQARLQLLKVEKAKERREQQKHQLFEKIQKNMIENDNRRRKYIENKQEKLHSNNQMAEMQLQQVLWQGYQDIFGNLQNGEFLQLLTETSDCQEIQLIINNFQLYNIKQALQMTITFLEQQQNQQRPDYLYILFYATTFSLLTSNQFYTKNIDYSQNSYEYQIVIPQQQSDSVYQIPGILYEPEFLYVEFLIIKYLMDVKNQNQDMESLQFYYYKLQQFENQVIDEIQNEFIQKYAHCMILQDLNSNIDQILLNIIVYAILQKVDYPMVVSEKYIMQMKTSKQKQKWIYDQFSSCQYSLRIMDILIKNGIYLEFDQLIKYYELLNSQAAQIVLSKATYSASQQQIENISVQSETLYSEFLSLLYSILYQINTLTLLVQDKLNNMNDIDCTTTKQEILIILQNLFSTKIIYNQNLIDIQQEFVPRCEEIFIFQIYNKNTSFKIEQDDQRFLFQYQQNYNDRKLQTINQDNICNQFIIQSLIFAIRVGKLIQYPYQFFEDVIQSLPPECFVTKESCQLINQLAQQTNYQFNYEQNLLGLI